jgi:RNA polymerase sigma-70 factor, ECF subfamily
MTAGATAEEHNVDLSSTYLSSPGELVAIFRSRGVSPDEAQDLAHETILRVLVHVKRHGRTREDLGPLARTIARNLLVERLRRGRIQTVALSDAGDVADEAPDPFDHAVDSERRDAVRTALRSLTPRHRRVVELWMQGRSPAEIARDLGIKRNAADALLHRARRTLASRLGPRTLWSGITLPFFRTREAIRDWADSILFWSPSITHSAPAALSVAGVALAALLGSATPRTTVERPVQELTSARVSEGIARSTVNAAGSPSRFVGNVAATRTIAEPDREIEVAVGPDVADEQQPVGVGLDHVRDDKGEHGKTGSTVDTGLKVLCSALGGTCSE